MMQLDQKLKRHRFPLSIISQAVWLYHRFNHSYRDVQEQLAFRGIILSHEIVRYWCINNSAASDRVFRRALTIDIYFLLYPFL